MNIREYRQLQAERSALETLLARLPESSVIERMGLSARKAEVEAALATQNAPARDPVRARLTFRGKPIIGSQGIFAEFGADALNAFTAAVAAIGASRTLQLGARGVLPNRDEYRLLITGTVPGSFGFELEEAPQEEMLFPAESRIESAIEQAKTIMQATVGNDDELTDAISDTDPRALEALRKFFRTLADHEAICALEFKGDVFRFADVGQVRRCEARLSRDNIHEHDQGITGQFQGVLPNHRTFEFLINDTGEVISGKVGPEIEDPSEINRQLEKTLTIRVHTRRVGSGRPRYTLLGYDGMADREKTDNPPGQTE